MELEHTIVSSIIGTQSDQTGLIYNGENIFRFNGLSVIAVHKDLINFFGDVPEFNSSETDCPTIKQLTQIFIHKYIYTGNYELNEDMVCVRNSDSFLGSSQHITPRKLINMGVEIVGLDGNLITNFILRGCSNTDLPGNLFPLCLAIHLKTEKSIEQYLWDNFNLYIKNNNVYPSSDQSNLIFEPNHIFKRIFKWDKLQNTPQGILYEGYPILHQVLYILSNCNLSTIDYKSQEAIVSSKEKIASSTLEEFVMNHREIVESFVEGDVDSLKEISEAMAFYKEHGHHTLYGSGFYVDVPRVSLSIHDNDITLPACTFLIPFYPSSESILCLPQEKYFRISKDGSDFSWHPHISTMGSCCMPIISKKLIELAAVGDFNTIKHQLINFLKTFNAQDPYSPWSKITQEESSEIAEYSRTFFAQVN